jgi:hypothetical protein
MTSDADLFPFTCNQLCIVQPVPSEPTGKRCRVRERFCVDETLVNLHRCKRADLGRSQAELVAPLVGAHTCAGPDSPARGAKGIWIARRVAFPLNATRCGAAIFGCSRMASPKAALASSAFPSACSATDRL